MIGRAILYWCAVWVVCFLGVQLFYWITFATVSVGSAFGWTDGGWAAPLSVAFGRGMIVFPALVASVVTPMHWRDWVSRDTQ